MAHPSSDEETDHRFGPIGNTILTGLSQDNLFYTAFCLVQVLAVLLIGLCVLWAEKYLNGYSLSTPAQIFNYHPLFMTIGMIVLNANGMLIYRLTRWLRFKQQKLLHFAVQLSALVVSIVGVYAAFHFHNKANIPNMYSLHSWLGITAVSGFAFSLMGAFFSFLYPGIDPVYRRLVLPFHIFGGIAILGYHSLITLVPNAVIIVASVIITMTSISNSIRINIFQLCLLFIVLSAAVAITGITEKAIFSLKTQGELYKDLPAPAVVLNLFGITIAIFAALVIWLVTKPEFKRKYIPGVNAPQYKLRREQTTE